MCDALSAYGNMISMKCQLFIFVKKRLFLNFA